VLKREIAELNADLKECQTNEAVVAGLQKELEYTQREKGITFGAISGYQEGWRNI
jgi:hypothetical protein